MKLARGLAIHLIWNIIRVLFLLLQWISWLLNGTQKTLKKNYSTTTYNTTAHILNIIARHKFDLVLQPSGPDNFIAVHSSFEDPEYVLSDNVSLYYVNQKEAVFVESDKGVDVSKSDYAAFYRIAQFYQAKKLIILPLHVFNKIGAQIGKTKAKIIFLSNTGRCGSTLVTQVFEQTGSAVAYSEPDALNALTQLRGLLKNKEVDEIVISVINIMCRPVKDKQIDAYIFKINPPTMRDVPEIVRLFPDVYNIFLYRDGLKVSQSLARTTNEEPMAYLLILLGSLSPILTQKLIASMGLPSEAFKKRVCSAIHVCSILWASCVHHYLNFREQGIKIVALRYEEIVADPSFSFKKMFEYCDLPFDAQAVERAMNRDSQRVSPLSMENLKKYKIDRFTPEIKKQTDEVCDYFHLPHFPESYVSPGTINQKITEN